MKKIFILFVSFLAVVFAVSLPAIAGAETIWDQPDTHGWGVMSQIYSNWGNGKVVAADDFTTTQSYTNLVVTAWGSEMGDAADNIAVWARIYDISGNLIYGTQGGYETLTGYGNEATLTIDFGSIELAAGHYRIMVGTIRTVDDYEDGAWHWDSTSTVTGLEAVTRDYSGVFFGSTDWMSINAAYDHITVASDLAFTITGDEVFFLCARTRNYAAARPWSSWTGRNQKKDAIGLYYKIIRSNQRQGLYIGSAFSVSLL